MSVQLVTLIRGELELEIVPECFQERFVEMVLDLYRDATEGEGEIPDVVLDIDACSGDFFLVVALASEENDPLAFDNRMREMDTVEERRDLLEDLVDEFNSYGYEDLRYRYIDDIASVCDFYQLTYTTSIANPLQPMTRYYEMHNYPIVEVW